MSARRRRLSVAQWRERVSRFDPQAETVAGFCKREGVCTASFYRWRSRLAGQAGEASSAGRKAGPATSLTGRDAGFVDLGPLVPTTSADAPRASAGLLLRLELGGGVALQISRP